MTKNREYFVNEPIGAADACVIWMHGLGADGKDFLGIVDELGLPINHAVRFIFPSAPFINITINNGMLMRGWYDIFDLTMVQKEDASGMKRSQEIVNDIIQHELDQGIASQRIILAGFSQGGAMSLYTGLRYQSTLAGIICLSAYLPLVNELAIERSQLNQKTPIFMAHGIFDPVVPYNMGHMAYEYLNKHDYNVAWHSYPMAHTLCIEEIVAIGNFINRCLGYD
jgi:phospholipase/carboxylesterase